MIKRYRKKPSTIEAVHFRGPEDYKILETFAGHWISILADQNVIWVTTPNGAVKMQPGEYLAKGLMGEFYPIAGKLFWELHDEVD